MLPVINGYWERAEFPWPLIEKLGAVRARRRRDRGLRLPADGSAVRRPDPHGAEPRRRQPRHVPRRAGRAGHALDRHARLRGAEAAVAAADGAAGQARCVRAHRAGPRLGLGRAGDLRPPRRRVLRDQRPQEVDRQRHHRRRRRGVGAGRCRRAGQGLPGGEGHPRLPGQGDRGQGFGARGLAGRDRARRACACRPRTSCPARESFKNTAAVLATTRVICAWAALGPRGGRLRRRADLRPAPRRSSASRWPASSSSRTGW